MFGGTRKSCGTAAFSMLVGIALIVAALGTALALLAFLEGLIGFGHAKSGEAYFAAQSGAQDALMRIALNKDYPRPPDPDPVTYNLDVGSGTATVTVDKDNPGQGRTLINSVGTAENRKRKIEVIVSVDGTTGETRIISWKEITI